MLTLRVVQRCPSTAVLSSCVREAGGEEEERGERVAGGGGRGQRGYRLTLMGIDFPFPRAPSRRTRCHRACAAVAPSPLTRHHSPFRTSVAPSPLGAFPSVKATTSCTRARRPSVSSRTATAPSPSAQLPQHAFPFCSVSALSPPARSRYCFHRRSGQEARRTFVRGVARAVQPANCFP